MKILHNFGFRVPQNPWKLDLETISRHDQLNAKIYGTHKREILKNETIWYKYNKRKNNGKKKS